MYIRRRFHEGIRKCSKMLRLLVLLLVTLCCVSADDISLEEEYSWKRICYNWSSLDGWKDHFVREGLYTPNNVFPIGFATWKDRVFVATPRYKTGVPSSLNYFRIGADKVKTPKMNPYPSWSENLMPNSLMKDYEYPIKHSGYENFKWFVSVMRVQVDKCDRLWALDAGYYNMSGIRRTVYNPSIMIFDLKTDQIVERHFFDDSIVQPDTFLGHMTVESDEKKCGDAFAYISDLGASKMFIYDFKQNKSWDVRHHYFNFEPIESQFKVDDITIRWTDGVVSSALSSPMDDGSRKVYFHATSASNEFEVSNEVLKNETWAHCDDNYDDFKLVGNRGSGSQSSISVYDEKNDLLILSQLAKSGLACWDAKKEMNADTMKMFVVNKAKLSFPSDMKIGSDGNLWVMSNRLHTFIYGSLDLDEVNFRLMKISLNDIKSACK